jgi:ABC-type transport system involved in cytochrome c biogenesis permease subunit
MTRRTIFPLALFILLCAARVAAGDSSELDWSAWLHMPVFHNGRMMPLNTFARMTVERTCGRVSPQLGPPREGIGAGQAADAGKLFPDGKPRRFTAAELLFSWLVEPEQWEDVPFLAAGYEPLRKDLLDQPIRDAEGRRLKYVSPRQAAGAGKFRLHLTLLAEKQDEARQQGQPFEPSKLDKKVEQLSDAYTLFRLLTFNPADPAASRNRLRNKLDDAFRTWHQAVSTWQAVEPALQRRSQFETGQGPGPRLVALGQSLQELRALARDDQFTLEAAEGLAVRIARSASQIADQAARYRERVLQNGVPADGDAVEYEQLCIGMRALASQTADLARQANDAHLALYDNGYSLRLVPALNPAALQSNRSPDDDAHPWLNLQTLISGSEEVLAAYPQTDVQRVRESFREVADVYKDRDAADRPQRFAAAMDRFAAAVRWLGEAIEPLRQKLPIKERDEKLLALTAYPPPGSTRAEVHYYELDPFLWSWLVSFGSMACFGLAFGVLRKPMFWLGIVALAAAQLFTIYGFALRVYITGWAPVTNMYETIIFVALVAALFGLWFVLYPMFGAGLRSAWRMTAVPGTFEAYALTEEQTALVPSARWKAAGWVVLLPRLALAVLVFVLLTLVPYGSGEGYTAVSLLPRTAVGSSVPTVNNVIVWVAGLSTLLLTVWYVPRAVLAFLLAVVMIPRALAKQGLAKPLRRTLARKPFALAGALVAFLAALIAYYAPVSGKDISPLMPVLRDNFWLTLHVLTITASYSAGFLALVLGLIALGYYLFGRYRDPSEPSAEAVAKGHRPAGGYQAPPSAFARRPPEACATLGTFIYRATQAAFLLLAIGTITGALWADVSWGRFWGWDPKEVWALISLLVYAAVLHGRYAGLFGNFGLAVASVFGATSILMAWYGVNDILPVGLHSYGTGSGGVGTILTIVGLTWAFVGFASFRYFLERRTPVAPASPASGSPAAEAD